MRFHGLSCGWVIIWCFVSSIQLWSEDPPPEPAPVAGEVGSAVVSFELLGRGLIPTARIVITNTSPVRIRLPRRWTYEVIPQPGIIDAEVRSSLSGASDEQRIQLKDRAYTPDQRVWLTLSERVVFGRSQLDDIIIAPRGSWGHDHVLDVRPGHFKPGPVFIRFSLESNGLKSDWLRLIIPDVPAVPLVRLTDKSRKLLGEVPFARAVKEAGRTFIARADSGDHPWTRVLTLDDTDPLAKILPKLLLDGRSMQMFDDGVRCRFAVRGISEAGEVDTDAEVMAVQPLD